MHERFDTFAQRRLALHVAPLEVAEGSAMTIPTCAMEILNFGAETVANGAPLNLDLAALANGIPMAIRYMLYMHWRTNTLKESADLWLVSGPRL